MTNTAVVRRTKKTNCKSAMTSESLRKVLRHTTANLCLIRMFKWVLRRFEAALLRFVPAHMLTAAISVS